MVSSIRLFGAVAVTLFATACGSASAPSDPAADPGAAEDTSEDELNTKARFTHLRSGPTDTNLAFLYKAGAKFDGEYLGVYRFNKPTNEATSADARMKRVKEVMHRYMCSFFDESIDIGRATASKAVSTTLADLDLDRNQGDAPEATVKSLSTALSFVAKNPSLDLMSGGASGNNTGGEVMGVYDIAHNEILFFGFTNCGSDD
jgi:hypothetical protein